MVIMTGYAEPPRPAVPLLLPGSWVEDAACDATTAHEHFASSRRLAARAVARCVTCPAMAWCREWAVRVNEPIGIWGGTTAYQRQLLRRALRENDSR